MSPFLLILLVALDRTAAAASPPSIHWSPCHVNTTTAVTCGTLSVPLDYTDPNNPATLDLLLVKVNATKSPCKGSILTNPGGPGEDGRNFLAGASTSSLLVSTGGHYDLITFDPRGTGDTLQLSCYKDPIQRQIFQLANPGALNASDTALGEAWITSKMRAEKCHQNNLKRGALIGTAFVARDMMRIVDALGGDRLLRYWGFSYGTILGMTVAAMFPDRMDKLVLDGNVNPHEYYAGPTPEQILQTDATLAGFFSGCLAAPKECALAHPGATTKSLSAEFYSFLEDLKYNPVSIGSDILTDIIDYKLVKNVVFSALYSAASFPALASVLDGLYNKNYTEAGIALAALGSGPQPFPTGQPTDALDAIQGSDSAFRASSVDELLPALDKYYAASVFAGDLLSRLLPSRAQWKFKAKERYSGNFQVKTRNPVLFIQSPFDPVTSMLSARNASAGFEGSRLLQDNGYGHTSLSQPSSCTAKAVAAYFSNGTLPEVGTKCEPDQPLFAPPPSSAGKIMKREDWTGTDQSTANENIRKYVASIKGF